MSKAHKLFILAFVVLFMGAALFDYMSACRKRGGSPAGKGFIAEMQQRLEALKSDCAKGFSKASPAQQKKAAGVPAGGGSSSADTYFDTAQSAFRQKDYQTAIVNGELALDLWMKNGAPESTVLQCREFLATCYSRSKHYQKALAQYKLLQKRRPENKSYQMLGLEAGKALEQQQLSLARETLSKGMKDYSEGSYHRAFEHAAGSVEMFKKLRGNDSRIASAYYLQARCCLKLANNDQAGYYMRRALHYDPANQTYKIALKSIPVQKTAGTEPVGPPVYVSNGVYKNNPASSYTRPPELPGANTVSQRSRNTTSYGGSNYSRSGSTYGSGSSSRTRNSGAYGSSQTTYSSYGNGPNSFTIVNSGNRYAPTPGSSRVTPPVSTPSRPNIDPYRGMSTPVPDSIEKQRQQQMQAVQKNNPGYQVIDSSTKKFLDAYQVPSYSTGGGGQAYPPR